MTIASTLDKINTEKSRALSSILEELEAAKAKVRQQAQEMGQPLIVEAAAPLFKFGVQAVRWYQYTPYFNDGEPCEFSVHGAMVQFDSADEGGDYEDGFHDYYSIKFAFDRDVDGSSDSYYAGIRNGVGTKERATALYEAVREFENLICSSAAEEFMEALYGDHVKVTLYADGTVDVDDYAHD